MNGSQTWEPMESQYLLEESVERKKYPGIYLFDLQQSSQMFMSIGVIQLTLRSPQSPQILPFKYPDVPRSCHIYCCEVTWRANPLSLPFPVVSLHQVLGRFN